MNPRAALPEPQRVSLAAPGGETLVLRRLPAPGPARAVVVLVHACLVLFVVASLAAAARAARCT